LIRHSALHSAYDGEHDYQLVVTVVPELIRMEDPDSRVDWTSVRWTTDAKYVEQAEYSTLAGAALFTTKRAGKTRIGMSLETTEGARMQSEATLEISSATSDEWQVGQKYYSRGMMIRPPPPEDVGICGLPPTIELPRKQACGVCHYKDQLGGPCTPFDTAMYADDELIATFSRGVLPRDGFNPGAFLDGFKRDKEQGACVFKHLHVRDDIDEPIARGLVWKLRSLEPIVPEGFDPQLINPVERTRFFP
jgi:hypothetical protein